jgi:hypothetical protein
MPTKTELEAAYRATTYRVFLPGGAVDLRIDAAHSALAAWLAENGGEQWAILSAFNPRSEQRPAAENLERQAALEVALLEEGFEPFAGENVADGGAWPAEDTCFVPAIELAEAMALASRFGQNAIVFGEADGLPHLVWIEHEE